MRQLIQNLISNAIKFRRDGVTPEVDVAATRDEGWVKLVVSDNGIGFEPRMRGGSSGSSSACTVAVPTPARESARPCAARSLSDMEAP